MSEREARVLLKSARRGELCVRFVYDKQGRVFFGKDAPRKDALIPAPLLSRARRVAAVAAIGAMPLATQACHLLENRPDEMMGDIAYTPLDVDADTADSGPDAGGDADAQAKEDANGNENDAADASEKDGGATGDVDAAIY